MNFPLAGSDPGASDLEPDLAAELPKILRVPAVQGTAIKQLNNSVHKKAALETMKVLFGRNFSFFSISRADLVLCAIAVMVYMKVTLLLSSVFIIF